jgi:UDP-glucose 4-epimerase
MYLKIPRIIRFCIAGAINTLASYCIFAALIYIGLVYWFAVLVCYVIGLILFTSRTKELNFLILRPSNPFGPFQNPSKKQGFIAVAVDKMKKNQPIEVWGDGSVVRDYVWVGDLAQAMVKLLEKSHWNEIYNIGSGVGHSINAVLQIIQDLLPTRSQIIYAPPRSEDVKNIVLDIRKIQSDIVFQPLDLKRGVEMYIQGLEQT